MYRKPRFSPFRAAGWLTTALLAATFGCTSSEQPQAAEKPADSALTRAEVPDKEPSAAESPKTELSATASSPDSAGGDPRTADAATNARHSAAQPAAAAPPSPAGRVVPTAAIPSADEPPPVKSDAGGDTAKRPPATAPSGTEIADGARKATSRDELREYILKLARERGVEIDTSANPKPAASQPVNRVQRSAPAGASPIASTRSQLPTRTQPKPPSPTTPGTPAQADAGCGDRGTDGRVDLTPPPPDQPQPKFAVVEPTVKLDNVWRGERAEFVWSIRNDGQAPLNIQLTKR